MNYQRERFLDVVAEATPLLVRHWKEIAHYQDIVLNPDISGYVDIERRGGLRLFTARDGKKLAGYAVFFIRHNMHYQDSLQAVQDVLFLDEGYRKGFTGIKLIKYADEALRDEGVQVVYHHIKSAHNFGPILERMGYQLVDLIYARRLDHGNVSSDSRRSGTGRGVRGQESGGQAEQRANEEVAGRHPGPD
jgi:hypothetical protein